MENTDFKIPKHIAIIMDGNGRWAKTKGKRREFGHKAGAETVRNVLKSCVRKGVKYLTLYAFSNENWNRPKIEVAALMKLFALNLKQEVPNFIKNDIKLKVIGDVSKFSSSLQSSIKKAEEVTKDNKTLTLVLAISYGARQEIVNAAKLVSEKVVSGEISVDQIDENLFSDNLYTAEIPDPELLIRTSGEFRISNFLLWQIAYSEVFITDVLWPDFSDEHLNEALESFSSRERRFGKTSAQVNKC